TAAKLLTKSSNWSHVGPLLINLHCLPIKFRVQFQILVKLSELCMAKHCLILWNSYSSVFQAGFSDPQTRICWSFLVRGSKLKVTEPLRSWLLHCKTLPHKLEISGLSELF
ncbi:hypothetical protein LDENG_00166300, partial [Lucifuga dentata]